jgi:lipopolysaccharide export system permease protein
MPLLGNTILEKIFPYKIPSILDRYVFNELIPPFFFGIAIFTVLFMAAGPIFDMVNLIIKYRVPLFLVFEYALVQLPSFVAYALPMAVLLATLAAFSRFSGDHELEAMKAGGISFYRIIVPVLFFSSLVCLFSYYLYNQLGPECLYQAKVIIATDENQGQLPPLENIKFTSKTSEGLERITIAKSFDQQRGIMQGPVINDYAPNGNLIRITHAQQAIWKNQAWILVHGETFQFDETGTFQSRMAFKTAELNLQNTPKQVALLERSPDQMTSPQLRKTISQMERDPLHDADQIRDMWMHYYIRQALPFACLIFALLGAPSGIRPLRSSSQAGMATSVFVILLYYFAMAICKSLGEHGTLPLLEAAWLPNAAFLALGSWFLLKETT